MFQGFWNSYHQSFSQSLNLSPAFRADPSDTRIGVEASLVPRRNDDENASSELNNDDMTTDEGDENEIGEGEGEPSSKKRKKNSSKDLLYDFVNEHRKDRREDLARFEKDAEMRERTVKAAEIIADTGKRFLELLEKKWA